MFLISINIFDNIVLEGVLLSLLFVLTRVLIKTCEFIKLFQIRTYINIWEFKFQNLNYKSHEKNML